MIRLSQVQFDAIYSRLGVKFDHALGESFYNPQLGEVVDDFLQSGIARESEGAVGVFSDGTLPPKEDPFLVNRDGEWIPDPALVRKSDGGFNYTTTDLATVDYRLKTWLPHEIIYVVDDRQSGHFKKLFRIIERWKPDVVKTTKLIHVGFGKILDDDGRPFKTRSGDTVKLGDLLDEAQERAFELVKSKQMERDEPERVLENLWPEIARVVGIGLGQVRRPPTEITPERLYFQLGQDACTQRQHRAVSAICLCADQKHFQKGGSVKHSTFDAKHPIGCR